MMNVFNSLVFKRFSLISSLIFLLSCQSAHTGEMDPDSLKSGNSAVIANKSHATSNWAPRGLFISAGPVVSDALLGQKNISGTLVRVPWRNFEPVEGQYDFTEIDRKIHQAKKLGKKVTLSLLNGPFAPEWLYQKGVTGFNYTFRNRYTTQNGKQEKIPLPWDPIYLKSWRNTIKALGQRYAHEKTIALVHITYSSKNGFEMHLPEERLGRQRESIYHGPWKDAGYTEEKFITALKQVVDAFMQSFPQHALDIEIHPVLESTRPAKELFAYGKNTYGKRFGLFSAWWSGILQRWNSGITDILTTACQQTFCTVQLIGNEKRQPRRLLDGSAKRTVQQAYEMGARYFEVWDVDLKDQQIRGRITDYLKTESANF